jgi:hypothetical protein
VSETKRGHVVSVVMPCFNERPTIVYEVPLTYKRRTYAEGKKIGLEDAFRAMYCLARYGIVERS